MLHQLSPCAALPTNRPINFPTANGSFKYVHTVDHPIGYVGKLIGLLMKKMEKCENKCFDGLATRISNFEIRIAPKKGYALKMKGFIQEMRSSGAEEVNMSKSR